MRIGLVLFLISIITSLGPILIGVVIYRDNLIGIVMPTEETIDSFESLTKASPSLEYAGYEIINSESLRVKLSISNPYDMEITINTVTLKAFCHNHTTFIGTVSGENTPLKIPAKTSRTLNIKITYTPEGKNDINTYHRGVNNLYLDLKDIYIDIQGIEVTYTGDITQVGPILIPS